MIFHHLQKAKSWKEYGVRPHLSLLDHVMIFVTVGFHIEVKSS
jgi:hypothetical protein